MLESGCKLSNNSWIERRLLQEKIQFKVVASSLPSKRHLREWGLMIALLCFGFRIWFLGSTLYLNLVNITEFAVPANDWGREAICL